MGGGLPQEPEFTPYQGGVKTKDPGKEETPQLFLLCLDHLSHVPQPEPQSPTRPRAADTFLSNAELGQRLLGYQNTWPPGSNRNRACAGLGWGEP